MTVHYYKVIGADNKSCHGGNFDWTPYLPKEGMPGEWTPEITDVIACERGYHVTEYWNMWYKKDCRIFECEVGRVVGADATIGVVDKVVCTRVRLLREIIPVFHNKYNTGDNNTGHYNIGDYNTGDSNTGHYNTGNGNTGDNNTGHYNTGDRNTGNYNTGGCNTGNGNTGNYNTGHYNTGGCNTGDYNTGGCNTGDYNTGNHNTGNHNICNHSSGFFNTINDTINIFNKPCKIDVWMNATLPAFINFKMVGTYLESWRKAYDGATSDDKLLLVKLPNFDADVFYEISGIMVDPKTGKEVI